MGGHRRNFKKYLNGNCPLTTSFLLFEEFGIENCKIELVEEFPCENLEQLLKKEGGYIQSLDCVNRCVVGRTRQEYRIANKDKIREYQETNKDKIKEYQEANKAKISEYRKTYCLINKDRIKETSRIYRESNKDKMKEYRT